MIWGIGENGCTRHIDDFASAACRGVAELHKRGIVYRDLKPGNILFRENGEPVIVDLGLAKCPTLTGVESDASLENGKPIGVGTPGYAAPEQFMGGGITSAADVHALGVLTERIVTQKEWGSGVLAASCRYRWGGDILVAACWRRIIRRATSSIPSERYPSVESFAAAIRRRHWPLFATIAVLILSVVLAWAMLVGRAVPARRNPDQTQSALSGDSSLLEETTMLNGSTKVFSKPIVLSSNCTYRITGPGTPDADISGPTNSPLVLKNCVLINRTRDIYPKNGVHYHLENGVYLNFINQKERPQRFRQFILPYDAAYNEVRFAGQETLKELNRLRNKESMDIIRRG